MYIRQLSKVLLVALASLLITQSPLAEQQRQRIGVVGAGDSQAYQDLVVMRLTRDGWISTAEEVERLRTDGFVVSERAVIRAFELRGDHYGATATMLHLAMYRPDHIIALGNHAGEEVAANMDAPLSILRAPETIVTTE